MLRYIERSNAARPDCAGLAALLFVCRFERRKVSADIIETLLQPGVQRLTALFIKCGARCTHSGRRNAAGRRRSICSRRRRLVRRTSTGHMLGTVQSRRRRRDGLLDDAGRPLVGLALIDGDRIEVIHVVVLDMVDLMLQRCFLDLGWQGGVDID